MISNLIRSINYDWLGVLLGLIASTLVLGGVLPLNSLYYCIIILIAMLSIIRGKRINVILLLFPLCLLIGLIINLPPSYFRSWERFGAFMMLYIATMPVFSSKALNKMHLQLFRTLLIISVIIGVGSFLAYFLGINLMRRGGEADFGVDEVGKFGGLACHSMILGPLAAITTSVLTHKSMISVNRKKKIVYCILAIISACSMFLSASRGSVLSCLVSLLVLVIVNCYGKTSKLIKTIIISITIIVASFPVYAPILVAVIAKQEFNNRAGGATSSRAQRWEHRLIEFSDNPIFGIGFSSMDPQYSKEFDKVTGVMEPGSSWLVILSQTGLVCAIIIFGVVIKVFRSLYKLATKQKQAYSALLLAILSFFTVHFIAEGYIYAAGSFLCLMFWTTLGCAYTHISTKYQKYDINIWTPKPI